MSNNIKHNLHNTHSWNRLLHRFKGHLELAVRYCKWRKGDRGGGFVSTLSSGCRGVGGRGFGHCSVTQTQCSKSSKFTKHQNSSFSIVMQYTCWHDWDNDVKFIQEFPCPVWQWKGSDQVGWRISHLSPGSCIPGKVTQIFQPFCQGSRGWRPSAGIHN